MIENFIKGLEKMPWNDVKVLMITNEGIVMQFFSGNGLRGKAPSKEQFEAFISVAQKHLPKEKIIDGRNEN